MDHKSAWEKYSDKELRDLDEFCSGYIDFISTHKTERECIRGAIRLAEKAGYVPLESAIARGSHLRAGDKVYAHAKGKTLLLAHIGHRPLVEGLNILGAHIDSPRLDIKQNPLFEKDGLALLDTHYYGGIKKYQWLTVPLALHGVVAKMDGTVIPLVIGEEFNEPVFCISDLLPHLSGEQVAKQASEFVDGEALDILVGARPLRGDGKEADGNYKHVGSITKMILNLLDEKYGIGEEDFRSAEIEAVPAGRAREMGFDRSMVLGYGQDDRSCAYPSLISQLLIETPERTAVTLLVDKEEIGSIGATGVESVFFENSIAEIMELASEGGQLPLRRALASSKMLSSDVSAGFDPSYASVFEEKNTAYLGYGLVFNKYTGARGKSGANDASAEYVAEIRRIMHDAEVACQTAEVGRVDAGGGGTIAGFLAKYGMDVIDSGVAVLSMHAPWEITNKADLYEARKGYTSFLVNAL